MPLHHRGEDGGHLLRLGIGGGCVQGPGAIRRSRGADVAAPACGGSLGSRSPLRSLGRTGLLQCTTACASVPTGGEQFTWAAFRCQGLGSRVTGLCAVGVCRLLGSAGVPWGVRLCVRGVWRSGCGGRRVTCRAAVLGGRVRAVGSGGGIRVAGLGAMRAGRVWAFRWVVGREGQGVWRGVPVRCVCALLC